MKKNVLGFRVDLIDFEGALERAVEAARAHKNLHIVTINPEMIMYARKWDYFARILHDAELVIPDGMGVKLALKFKGVKQEQIRGVDFSLKLIEAAAANGFGVALLGAKEEVLQKTCETLKAQFNNLNIVYAQNGYFENDDEVVDEIAKAAPQLVLVALGSPRQEVVISKLKTRFSGGGSGSNNGGDKGKGAVMIGVGGTFDVLSGNVKQAPAVWQKLGLEWLYRTLKQPRRIRRIFPTLPLFLFRSIIEAAREPRS